MNGALDISSLSAANPLKVKLHTLDGGNNANPLDVWNPAVNHTWSSIVSSTAGFVGDFDPTLFQVDATNFQSPISGAFSVIQNGTNIDLQYDATMIDASILVTNLAEPFRSATPISNPQYWGAQSFSPDAQRYALTSVAAVVGNAGGSPGIVAELRRADANGDIDQTPEGLLTTFTAPDLTGDPAARLFTPDAGVTLEPETKYWFVLGNTDTGTFDWSYADTNNTLGPGTLGNYGDTSDAGVTWDYRGSEFPYFIQVKANAVAGPFLEADFDENGVVDANDLTLWTSGFATASGATHMQGDADFDGDVDGADFLAWQRQLGSGTPATAASDAVPEPATVLLLILAASGLCLRQSPGRIEIPNNSSTRDTGHPSTDSDARSDSQDPKRLMAPPGRSENSSSRSAETRRSL